MYGAGANDNTVFSAPFAAGVLPLNLIPRSGQGNNPVNTLVLNDVEAAQLQALFAPDLRVGLSASFTNAEGGPDRFFLGARTVGPTPIPEPVSMMLLGTGLLGVGLVRRRLK